MTSKTSKQHEEHSDSDDEMPEVVSNAAMKSSYDQLSKQLTNLKQQMKEAEKDKRRRKQEMFLAQKKTKVSKLEGDDATKDDDNSADLNDSDKASQDNLDDQKLIDTRPKAKPRRKVYSALNITVEPLTNKNDSRATAALDFRSRRLAKVHRESVKTAVISYQKKLQTRK